SPAEPREERAEERRGGAQLAAAEKAGRHERVGHGPEIDVDTGGPPCGRSRAGLRAGAHSAEAPELARRRRGGGPAQPPGVAALLVDEHEQRTAERAAGGVKPRRRLLHLLPRPAPDENDAADLAGAHLREKR